MHWSEVKEAAPDAIGIICCGYGLEENVAFARDAMLDPKALGDFEGPVVAFDANRFFSRPTLSVVDGAQRLQEAFGEGRESGDGYQRIRVQK